jgi:hypothetical protein
MLRSDLALGMVTNGYTNCRSGDGMPKPAFGVVTQEAFGLSARLFQHHSAVELWRTIALVNSSECDLPVFFPRGRFDIEFVEIAPSQYVEEYLAERLGLLS